MIERNSRSVVVVGGGLAGLSAACALADAGYRVMLMERRPYVGGRASSYEHPGTSEVIDNCQHVLIGRCTNLIDLYRRLGVRDAIRWYQQFTFVEPGGRQSVLRSTRLPAPLHSTPSFMAAHAFTWEDKEAIARGLMQFLGGLPPDSEEDFGHWLERNDQTRGAIERFWKPVLASALNEDPERISVHYAAKVFRESFLLSAEAGQMGIPSIPLSELYGHAVDYICARGGEVRLRTSVDAVEPRDDGGWTVRCGEEGFAADGVVLAVPFEGMLKLLPQMPAAEGVEALKAKLEGFEHSPITGIHLWFDRPVTELEHAVLLDSPVQWLFNKSALQPEHRAHAEHYVELVVSASRALVPMQRQEIVDMATAELARFFPVVREAKLVKAAVVKEVRATYSVRPGLDACRPAADESPWPGIVLAGDWTATGWPATMEGAVRSGYLAAEAVTEMFGSRKQVMVGELPHGGFMRLVPA
jgi:zeta-carotene desaturase